MLEIVFFTRQSYCEHQHLGSGKTPTRTSFVRNGLGNAESVALPCRSASSYPCSAQPRASKTWFSGIRLPLYPSFFQTLGQSCAESGAQPSRLRQSFPSRWPCMSTPRYWKNSSPQPSHLRVPISCKPATFSRLLFFIATAFI